MHTVKAKHRSGQKEGHPILVTERNGKKQELYCISNEVLYTHTMTHSSYHSYISQANSYTYTQCTHNSTMHIFIYAHNAHTIAITTSITHMSGMLCHRQEPSSVHWHNHCTHLQYRKSPYKTAIQHDPMATHTHTHGLHWDNSCSTHQQSSSLHHWAASAPHLPQGCHSSSQCSNHTMLCC